MPPKKRVRKTSYVPIESFLDALNAADPRPDAFAKREPKKAYSERLSNRIAVLIANRLRAIKQFKGEILPAPDGSGREKPVPSGSFNKPKKTDVNYSTLSGLELLVSIKTLGFRDVLTDKKKGEQRLGRYTKNMVRNDHELRAEAMDFHERYPFAVLAALFFIPRDACDDGEDDNKSSFAHAVMTFRTRAGRGRPDEPAQMFELFYIGLYDWEGENRGRVRFFDVMDAPKKRGAPSKLVELDAVINRVVQVYGLRNRLYIPWEEDTVSGGTPELSPPPEEESTAGDAADEAESAEEDGDQ